MWRLLCLQDFGDRSCGQRGAACQKDRLQPAHGHAGGRAFTPGGAISGGAFKNSSNLLGRRREIEQLQEKVKATLKQVDALLEEAEEIRKQRALLRVKLDQTKEQLQQEFIRQNTARMNVAAAREKERSDPGGL